ncbi:hypothetical protein OGATHE_000539 [Ogataea polymorpha]|uniref:Uncharacterized protein n=1 Tax=Ogataea polymorpha TaxID=460523 RepID=A0A9P8TGL6_9ASCO|nr:hypothetical protein OGATHE_000539 [Ogataea polymorpha]
MSSFKSSNLGFWLETTSWYADFIWYASSIVPTSMRSLRIFLTPSTNSSTNGFNGCKYTFSVLNGLIKTSWFNTLATCRRLSLTLET